MKADAAAVETLAAFVVDTPADWALPARAVAALALCDVLAVAGAARNSPIVGKALAAIAGRTGATGASVWWSGTTADAEAAAFVNGVMGHALDYDDVATAWRGHPSAVIYPALLASLPDGWSGERGGELLDAYAVAFQIGAKIGRRMLPGHYRVGWHSTATIGTIAATAGIARLHEMPCDRTAHALALGAVQAAGMQVSFGSDAKPAQAGFAAAAAVRAFRLAAAGFDGPLDIFEGRTGFAALHAGTPGAFEALGACAPPPLPALCDALEVKLLPTCYATHRALFATFGIVDERHPAAGDIHAVDVVSSPGSHDPLRDEAPSTALEAQFHMPTLIAMTLLGLRPDLGNLQSASYARPDVRAVADKVRIREEADGTPERWSDVRLELAHGRWNKRVAHLPRVTLSSPAWRAKLADCLAQGNIDPDAYRREITRLAGIEIPETSLAGAELDI